MIEIDERRIADSFFSKHWIWQIGSEELLSGVVASSVMEELARRLPHIAPDSWPARFELGGVYLAGRPAIPESRIIEPSRLEYYEPKRPLDSLAVWYPSFSSEWILYSDADLAIVYKPPGLPTTAARDQGRFNLATYLTTHYEKSIHLPSRLDTAVSGLLICSRSERMNRYLQKAYERRWIEKLYLAESSGIPAWDSRVIEWDIARDPRHPVLRRCVEQGEGESARTDVVCLERSGGRALLRARPLTGRTHQIRLHLSTEGLPIVGDPYYRGELAEELRLVSYGIRFHHPYKGEMFSIELPEGLRPPWLTSNGARASLPKWG